MKWFQPRFAAHNLAHTVALRKKGGPRPPSEFRRSGSIVYRPVFFACGLSVVRGERTRPVSREIFLRKISGSGTDHHAKGFCTVLSHPGSRKGDVSPISTFRRGRRTGIDPLAPTHPPRDAIPLSYTPTSRRRCCISYRCHCAPACSFRIHRRLPPRTLAFWLWCARP